MSVSPKPQAASHMFWFFLLPCLGFMVWASIKLVGGLTHKPVQTTLLTKVENIKTARSPGDRWQAAYSVSQELQKMIRNGELASMNPEQKQTLYGELNSLLEQHATDARLKKYLLLTIGQMKDVSGLPILERHLNDTEAEVKFFASWGFVEILSRHPETLTPARTQIISTWIKSDDSALQKIASSFLVQRNDEALKNLVRGLLKSEDFEVRWNAAVALASVGDASSASVLKEMFDLKTLRNLKIKTTKDLQQLVATGADAAVKLGNAEVIESARKLSTEVSAKNPEGRAILNGLAALKLSTPQTR